MKALSQDIINKNYCSDNYYFLQQLPSDCIDLICTDPNYGYSFMNLEWDKKVPSVEVLRECCRVLKPGAFAFFMAAPRQDVLAQMITNLGYAGFRTHFSSIYWSYATGFPKAADMSELLIKKHKKETEISKEMKGAYAGFQPKPAVEIVIVVMKPLATDSFVKQAMMNGKGVTWMDDCMIPYVNKEDQEGARFAAQADIRGGNYNNSQGIHKTDVLASERGRFPANLLVSDDVLNDGKEHVTAGMNNVTGGGFGGAVCYGENSADTVHNYTRDSGSYSRYFDLDAWFWECAKHIGEEQLNTFPFLVVPKPSTSEKNAGLKNFDDIKVTDRENDSVNELSNRLHNKAKKKNFHPTVKPITLMSYLITLGSREGDVVLDPWIGSGTTHVSSKITRRNCIGVDNDPDSVKLADARVAAVNVQLKMF